MTTYFILDNGGCVHAHGMKSIYTAEYILIYLKNEMPDRDFEILEDGDYDD